MQPDSGPKTKEFPDSQPLGKRLRNRRLKLGLTLQDVADGARLSVGFISQVERDLTSPSLSSLVGIARVLGRSVADFLVAPEGSSPSTRQSSREVYGPNPAAFGYERISANFPGHVLSSVIIHETPGHRSEPIRHEGEELFYMLEGSITVEVDGDCTVLRPGDSMHFSSMLRHSTWNHTTRPAKFLHVCTMDVFGDADGPAGQVTGSGKPDPRQPGQQNPETRGGRKRSAASGENPTKKKGRKSR